MYMSLIVQIPTKYSKAKNCLQTILTVHSNNFITVSIARLLEAVDEVHFTDPKRGRISWIIEQNALPWSGQYYYTEYIFKILILYLNLKLMISKFLILYHCYISTVTCTVAMYSYCTVLKLYIKVLINKSIACFANINDYSKFRAHGLLLTELLVVVDSSNGNHLGNCVSFAPRGWIFFKIFLKFLSLKLLQQ